MTLGQEGSMRKERLLRDFVAAYERLIDVAARAERSGTTRREDGWGPREVVAHLAGWEVMATVRIAPIVAGTPPMEFSDEAQARVMNNALNAAFVTLKGDQSLEILCDTLRRAYQRTVEILTPLDESHFQPGAYVYERVTVRGAEARVGRHVSWP